MTTDVRVLQPDDWERWFSGLELAFGGVREPDEARAFFRDVTEFERSLGVWDGDGTVGTAGAFSFRMTVPGGAAVATAGVTMVSVAPTHRRRGILTSMMRRQLDDVRALGEPLAVLTASEPAIYGRFGYGVATQRLGARIRTDHVRLQLPPGTEEFTLRLAEPADVLDSCEAVYARQAAARPGMLVRRPGWERQGVIDPAQERAGASALQCVLAERGGEVAGYARYRLKPEWEGAGVPAGVVTVEDLEASEPGAYAALCRYLFDLDLMSTVAMRNRPSDDAWQHLVSDIRRCSVALRDGLFLRPVEVGAALEARTYATDVDVVLDVSDPFCPWNTGRWRLSGGPKGAVCARTDDPADLTLSVRELGTVYLGGFSLAALAAAGRVREERRGALAAASLAFSGTAAPWLPHGF
ncbi:GNAT family N-acetyltransferase [Streptomyces sp. LHD-70]|uniref:GNAT family N-acetyltransferase n=1 Tax=Streptomyces sp. LHD-70 TaxID=3072140 RepID=UPI00280CBAB4|nr:GNAT family N-acetyltransferase [Streptomyces sp. LHD-70]MDQ8700944.1 GNAT family N-acetyltransferase [Streptomyces sp. LHD-70]